MLREGMDIIRTATQWYFSGGYTWILFLLSCVFLWMIRKQKESISFLIRYSIFYIIICYNPVSSIVLSKLGMDGVYWRSYWYLPIGVFISCAMTFAVDKISKKVLQYLAVIGCCAVLIITGSLIYTRDNYDIAKSPYKIPQKVIEVSDCIKNDCILIAPYDVMVWIRTYNADVILPYGRQSIFFGGTQSQQELYELVEEPVWDLSVLLVKAKEHACNYVISEKTQVVIGDWASYGFSLIDETDDYYVYYKEPK